MLARKFRLPSSIVFHNTRITRDSAFIMKVQKNDLSYNRYGFVVAKTIDKRATVRNRLKRIFRSVIEEKWLTSAGYDVLFILKPSMKDATREVLQGKINEAMRELV